MKKQKINYTAAVWFPMKKLFLLLALMYGANVFGQTKPNYKKGYAVIDSNWAPSSYYSEYWAYLDSDSTKSLFNFHNGRNKGAVDKIPRFVVDPDTLVIMGRVYIAKPRKLIACDGTIFNPPVTAPCDTVYFNPTHR